jgi:hypothetical protein
MKCVSESAWNMGLLHPSPVLLYSLTTLRICAEVCANVAVLRFLVAGIHLPVICFVTCLREGYL